MPLRSKSLCGFAFSANSQRNSGERPFFGYPCPPVVKCVDSTVFWTGENVPSERVRSKPADIGQLLLQCRRRCSRVIVSLIPPNHTLSRGGGNHLCTVSSAEKRTARENPPQAPSRPDSSSTDWQVRLLRKIATPRRGSGNPQQQSVQTFTQPSERASKRAAGPSVELEENSRLIEPKFRGENAVHIYEAQRWIAL